MYQNMFYNSGEVISDQFNHITLDSKSGKFRKKIGENKKFWEIFPLRGGILLSVWENVLSISIVMYS